jgi:hypothetical protein
MPNRFYVREDLGDDSEFATREKAEAYAVMLRGEDGVLEARVGAVLTRREREARDALVAAALAWIDAMSHGGTVTEVMAYCRSLATLNKATHAYRKAVST